MPAPATLLIAKILIQETGTPLTAGSVTVHIEKESKNIIDAAAAGASDGMKLAINIAAMLLAFVALIPMINHLIRWLGDWLAGFPGGVLVVSHDRDFLDRSVTRIIELDAIHQYAATIDTTARRIEDALQPAAGASATPPHPAGT